MTKEKEKIKIELTREEALAVLSFLQILTREEVRNSIADKLLVEAVP